MVSGWAARAGVLVFFLLSEMLITKSIISNVRRNGYFEPIDYLLNRIARIYPPFLFALVLKFSVLWIINHFSLPGSAGSVLGEVRPNGISFDGYRELVKSVLLIDGMTAADGPLWTLYIEVKFYFVAMGIAMALRGSSLRTRITGIALIAWAIWLGLDLYKFWFFAMIWALGAAANIRSMRSLKLFVPAAVLVTLAGYFYRGADSDYIDYKLGVAMQALGCALVFTCCW